MYSESNNRCPVVHILYIAIIYVRVCHQ